MHIRSGEADVPHHLQARKLTRGLIMCNDCFHMPRLSRRSLLWGGAAFASAAALSLRDVSAQSAAPQNAISPDEALKRLMDGNARYAANTSANKDYSAGRAARTTAQYPFAAILSCADSRVAPELAFDQAPGDLFVVRVAGNFVNDDGLASLEYTVKFLNTPLVMVLGHTNCGAVDAAIKVLKDKVTLPGHLPQLIHEIKPAVEAARRTSRMTCWRPQSRRISAVAFAGSKRQGRSCPTSCNQEN